MKTENIIWGLILVFIGSILLLDNFDVIDFYWRTVWRLWPLLLVIIGANIIFSGKHSQTGTVISIVITVVALGFIAYYGTRPQPDSRGWWPNVNIDIDNKKDKAFKSNASFSEPFESRIQQAELNIAGGATVYELEDTTANLFDAEVDQSWGNYSLEKVSKDSIEVLNFRMKNHNKKWNFDSDTKANEVRLRLNKKPVWDINVETGAGETNFDLTPFKVRNLKFKGGAASFEVKLGEPVTITDVVAETGVAEIKISVPSTAGCKIKVESGLSSKDFEGFTQQADGSYITSNYNSSAKKINISLKGGLSDFEVNRY